MLITFFIDKITDQIRFLSSLFATFITLIISSQHSIIIKEKRKVIVDLTTANIFVSLVGTGVDGFLRSLGTVYLWSVCFSVK